MSGWVRAELGHVATLQRGFDLPSRVRRRGDVPVVGSSGTIGWHDRAMVKAPGVVTGRYGTIGEVLFEDTDFWPLNTTLWVSNFHGNDERFIYYLLQRIDFATHSGKSGVPGVNRNDLHAEFVTMPSRVDEQRAIAATLDGADKFIATLEQLIRKKQAIRQAIMQQLLTGRTRLNGFNSDWASVKIEHLLVPRTERNIAKQDLEVLTCTKHDGFVRSLDFFKSQVFSRDLSGYRLIHRGDIGYPANHVEEGSIGVQNIVDAGLVSPIYVVMQPVRGVDTFFLQRQLKLETYRQQFARVTNASVDRRGSLRWAQFSQLEVQIPAEDEQRAISQALRDFEADLDLCQSRLEKAHAIKTGLMQQLLTGRTKLRMEAAT